MKVKINIPIFECSLDVYLVSDIRDMSEVVKDYSGHEGILESNIGAFSYRPFVREYVVAFEMPHDEDLGLISHESVHIANFIIEDCGIKSSVSNDELHAHLVQWLFNQINTSLKEIKYERSRLHIASSGSNFN